MAPRKSPKSGSPGPGARREAKHGNKSGKKEGASGSSFFTWFMVIALLGVWTSAAVVWFELVDYEEVLGKLGIYDADGDGDFDMEDAKVLLGVKPGGIIKSKIKVKGLKERFVPEQSTLNAEEVIQSAEKPHVKTEHIHVKTEPEDEIESLLHEVLDSQLEKGEIDEDQEEADFQEEEEKEDNNVVSEEPTSEQSYDEEIEDKMPEISERSNSIQEESAIPYKPGDHEVDDTDTDDSSKYVEEDTYEPEIPESFAENTKQHDYVDELELESEDLTEILSTESTDHIEQRHEHNADVPDSVIEPTKSVHEKKHTEELVTAQPHETEVPVQAEDYSEDDIIDT